MVTPVSERVRKPLPTRIRVKKGLWNSVAMRLALADRIAAFPGIEMVEARPGAMPHRVEVYLRTPSASNRPLSDTPRLCTISRDKVVVYGLGDGDKFRVLSRGWARLQRRGIRVFLPRDSAELDVCWVIVECAYRCLQEALTTIPQPKRARFAELPGFSRTTLQ